LLKELILKGNEHSYKKEYQKASEWYEKALEIDTKYVEALSNKGLALYNLGKYEAAIADGI
jgi:tetratricopeptide (TPR) repeat protein